MRPADAVAASKCVLARLPGTPRLLQSHPERCAWCDWPVPELLSLVVEFNENPVGAERFQALPRSEQARLVHEAQYPKSEVAA